MKNIINKIKSLFLEAISFSSAKGFALFCILFLTIFTIAHFCGVYFVYGVASIFIILTFLLFIKSIINLFKNK